MDGEYTSIEVVEDDEGALRGHSEVLDLDICVLPVLDLRLYDPIRGDWLPSYREIQDSLQAERQAREAAESESEAKSEAFRAERAAPRSRRAPHS